MQIAVLFGGKSGEYAVSCISAASVLENINKEKYSVLKIGITKDGAWFQTDASPEEIRSGEWVEKPKTKAILSPDPGDHGFLLFGETGITTLPVDVIFPVMHGDYCEDGCLQGLFELAGIPYVGCGVCASAAGMDKEMSKALFSGAGIPVAEGFTIERKDLPSAEALVAEKLTYPVFVKPVQAGSSLGASKVMEEKDLSKALRLALEYDERVLIEEYIDAREIECAVLGNETVLPSILGEIVPEAEFYDYEAKYIHGTSKLLVPAPLSEADTKQIQDYALRAFRAIGGKGLSRVDFFKDKRTGRVVINEINTMPGFTQISMYPKLWQATGYTYEALIDKLIELAGM